MCSVFVAVDVPVKFASLLALALSVMRPLVPQFSRRKLVFERQWITWKQLARLAPKVHVVQLVFSPSRVLWKKSVQVQGSDQLLRLICLVPNPSRLRECSPMKVVGPPCAPSVPVGRPSRRCATELPNHAPSLKLHHFDLTPRPRLLHHLLLSLLLLLHCRHRKHHYLNTTANPRTTPTHPPTTPRSYPPEL